MITAAVTFGRFLRLTPAPRDAIKSLSLELGVARAAVEQASIRQVAWACAARVEFEREPSD